MHAYLLLRVAAWLQHQGFKTVVYRHRCDLLDVLEHFQSFACLTSAVWAGYRKITLRAVQMVAMLHVPTNMQKGTLCWGYAAYSTVSYALSHCGKFTHRWDDPFSWINRLRAMSFGLSKTFRKDHQFVTRRMKKFTTGDSSRAITSK